MEQQLSFNLANQEKAKEFLISFQTKSNPDDVNWLTVAEKLFTDAIYELETNAVRIEEDALEQGTPSFALLSNLEEHYTHAQEYKATAQKIIERIRALPVSEWIKKYNNEWFVRAEQLFAQTITDLDTINIVDGSLQINMRSFRSLVALESNWGELIIATDPQTMTIDLQDVYVTAVRKGDIDLVTLLIEDERIARTIESRGDSLLIAVEGGQIDMVRFLLENKRGHNINYFNVLRIAIVKGDIDIIRLLLTEPLDSFDNDDWFEICCHPLDNDQIEIVRLLLTYRDPSGHLIVDPSFDDNCLLRYASTNPCSNLDIIKFLLEDERVISSLRLNPISPDEAKFMSKEALELINKACT